MSPLVVACGSVYNCLMTTPLIRSAILAFCPLFVVAGAQPRFNPAPPQDCAHFIAHVRQNDVSFSVSIESTNDALGIVVPEKNGVDPAPIRVRLKMRDETIIEGVPQRLPSVGSGGWVDWRYRLAANRPLTISDIFSVSISIGDRAFEVCPW